MLIGCVSAPLVKVSCLTSFVSTAMLEELTHIKSNVGDRKFESIWVAEQAQERFQH